ncbi:hypothetical protein JP75_07940 [Devosia riboflavina]|uniref:Uncharacterized protein n=1 Tax=Devosia riboflavina TaxID=46914 RepID=A0A087M3L5_9HYPH|nr:hypothetical protein [Devosia riboflavina]KFL31468.1 hypothetical protein JP75_07940 [Devosia riboflavina]
MSPQEWLDANGGPRRFRQGDTADPFSLQPWLQKRGYELLLGKNQFKLKPITSKRVKGVVLSRPDFLAFVDQLRIAEGLEPIIPSNKRQQNG